MLVIVCALACGLASFICLRYTPLRWNVALALAAVGSPFAPLKAAGAALGIIAALARHGTNPAPTRRRPDPIDADGLAVGEDPNGRTVRIPLRDRSGTHTLVVGATGSGKTVTEAWIVARAIEHGHGAVIVDPKGDELLRAEARDSALAAGSSFLEWTPRGPCVY